MKQTLLDLAFSVAVLLLMVATGLLAHATLNHLFPA